jgi:predicted Fe-Mo cluster-binding NifX family protein
MGWRAVRRGRAALDSLFGVGPAPDLDGEAGSVAERVEGVIWVEEMRVRRLGSFWFAVGRVRLRRSAGVEAVEEVVNAITEALPRVEAVMIELEGADRDVVGVMLSAEEANIGAMVADDLAAARFFVFATLSTAGGEHIEYVENPACGKSGGEQLEALRGLLRSRTINVALARNVDQDYRDVLEDCGAELRPAPDATVRDVLDGFAGERHSAEHR